MDQCTRKLSGKLLRWDHQEGRQGIRMERESKSEICIVVRKGIME